MDRGGPRPGQDDRDLADRFKLNISDDGDGKCLNFPLINNNFNKQS